MLYPKDLSQEEYRTRAIIDFSSIHYQAKSLLEEGLSEDESDVGRRIRMSILLSSTSSKINQLISLSLIPEESIITDFVNIVESRAVRGTLGVRYIIALEKASRSVLALLGLTADETSMTE